MATPINNATYTAMPRKFQSKNPIIKDATLEAYDMVLPGQAQPTTLVTHKGLTRWLAENQAIYQIEEDLEIHESDGTYAVTCRLKSPILKNVAMVGSATKDNVNSEIGRNFMAEMASNRAFDRALLMYLAIDCMSESEIDPKEGTFVPPELSEKEGNGSETEVKDVESFIRHRQPTPIAPPQEVKTAPPVQQEKPEKPAVTTEKTEVSIDQATKNELYDAAGGPLTEAEVKALRDTIIEKNSSGFNGKPLGFMIDSLPMLNADQASRAKKELYYMMTETPYKAKLIRYLKQIDLLGVSKKGTYYVK